MLADMFSAGMKLAAPLVVPDAGARLATFTAPPLAISSTSLEEVQLVTSAFYAAGSSVVRVYNDTGDSISGSAKVGMAVTIGGQVYAIVKDSRAVGDGIDLHLSPLVSDTDGGSYVSTQPSALTVPNSIELSTSEWATRPSSLGIVGFGFQYVTSDLAVRPGIDWSCVRGGQSGTVLYVDTVPFITAVWCGKRA